MSSTKKAPPFSDEELKLFLSTRRAVVISAQQANTKAVRKLMVQLGCKPNDAIPCLDFEEAKKEILSKPTHLLITDLFLEKNTGIELMALQESLFKSRLDVATIIMSPDPSNSSTGLIAESNVDGVLVKPFTLDSFKGVLYQALENKVKPSAFWKTLEGGKEQLKLGNLEDAEAIFEGSKMLDPSPTLAFYYLAEIKQKQGKLSEATAQLTEGLQLNPEDYRCLSAQFNIHMQAAEYPLAYESAKRLHAKYPISASRIPDVIKLSIYNKKFEDIVDYAKIFKQLGAQTPAITQIVIAGMLVCSKYFSLREKRDQALEMLESAAKASLAGNLLQNDVFRYYIETKNLKEGENFYRQFTDEFKELPATQCAYLEFLAASEMVSEVLQFGTKIIKGGLKSSRVYRLMIEYSKKAGRSESAIQNLLGEAKDYFPEEAF